MPADTLLALNTQEVASASSVIAWVSALLALQEKRNVGEREADLRESWCKLG